MIPKPDQLTVTDLTPIFVVSGGAVQYDLTDIDALNMVIDDFETSNVVTKDYRFMFQFESVLFPTELPTTCLSVSLPCDLVKDPQCEHVDRSNGSLDVHSGVAYRINNDDKSCVLLGQKGKFNTVLFDSKLPAKGIRVTYQGGYDANLKRNYQFHIDLECPNMAPDSKRNEKKMNLSRFEVTSSAEGTYLVHFITPLACPAACKHQVDDGNGGKKELKVCSGRGLCASDPFDKVTRCICDSGWRGDLCELMVPQPKIHTDTTWIVIVTLLIITVGVVSIVGITKYVKWKQRANIAWADMALRQNGLANSLMTIDAEILRNSVTDVDTDAILHDPYESDPKAAL